MKKFEFKALLSSFKTRAFRAGGYSIAATAIVLVMLILLNLLVGLLPAKVSNFDMTSNKLYSITTETKSILGQVDKDITIYWLISENAEDPYVESLLQLVQDQSKRIKVVKKDLEIYPEFARVYTDETPESNALIVECGELSRYLSYYEDIITYDLRDYYTTGTYTTYFNGEGALVGAIKYVTGAVLPKVYMLTGHGEANLLVNYTTAIKNQNIDLVELSLLEKDAVPEDADAVILCSPTRDITRDELERLQTYMAAGGNLLVMTNYYFETNPRPNLERLMESYGMASAPGLVMDPAGSYYYAYPYFPMPDMNSHATTDPLVEGKMDVILYTAHGIRVANELPSDLTVTPLLTTSEKAYAKQKEDAGTMAKQEGDLAGPFVMAAHGTKNAGTETESNVIWVGSGSLVDGEIDEMSAGANMDLFLNMLGHLAAPEEMEMTVHAKPLTNANKLVMNKTTQDVLAVVIMAVVPALLLGVGGVIWYRRKRR